MTRRLIEEWLPAAAIGMESLRERTPMTPFPAPNRLHVWFARRPLVASRAAILASLLPADADRDKFMHILGIHGDPVQARYLMDRARRTNERIENPYDYERAFKYCPSKEDLDWIISFGLENMSVLDPTAGGGSIPYESLRLGLRSLANDLNPVAAMILRGTIEFPSKHGLKLIDEYQRISKDFRDRIETKIANVFPESPNPNCIDTTYLFARTIKCPYCDGVVPLSPNWRLSPDGTGVRLKPNLEKRTCDFEIVSKLKDHSEGTVKGGDAMCCYSDCGRAISIQEIKIQGTTVGIGEVLYGVVYKERLETTTKSGKRGKDKWKRGYRAALPQDNNFVEIEVVS